MRNDMGRVVIERPRRGSRTADSAKVRHYGKIVHDEEGYDYEGFTRLPISRKQEGYNKNLGYKTFSDLLGPLNHYLESCCGRPWNDVWSEISRTLGRSGSEGIRHIKDQHIDVAVNTWRGSDGEVYENSDYGVHKVGRYSWRTSLYVEPETGILRKTAIRHEPAQNKPTDVIPITVNEEYRKINNIWYYQRFDVIEERIFTGFFRGIRQYQITKNRVMLDKKQLCKKALRKIGVRNAPR